MKIRITSILFILLGLCLHAQIPSDCLSHYYPFSGNADDVISGYDPIVVGNIQGVPDRFGFQNCAYSFDGEWTSVMLLQGGAGGYPVTSDSSFTISLWYRYGSNDASDREFLFDKGFAYDDSVSFSIYLYNQNTPVIGIDESQNFIDQSLVTWPNDSSWHHITAIFEPTGFKVYYDNQLALASTSTIHDMSADVHFGENFEGYLDDIAFYNKALNETEIAQLYNATSSCSTGLNDLDLELDINIYPNPSSDVLTIDLKGLDISNFEIINAEGKEVQKGSINSQIINVVLNNLSSGLYTIRLLNKEQYLGFKSFIVN